MAPYPGNQRWTPGVTVQPHSAPPSYIVDTGGNVFCRNSQHLCASTAAANQLRHVLCDDEPWCQPSEPPAAKEQQPPAAPPDLQASPHEVPRRSPRAQPGELYTNLKKKKEKKNYFIDI